MPGDPYWGSVSLLLPFDGTNGSTSFPEKSRDRTVTASGNAQISTTQSKFGSSSAYFDGTTDYLSVPNSADFQFGSGDFTIDGFVYIASAPAENKVLVNFRSSGQTSNMSYVLYIDPSRKLAYSIYSDGTNALTSQASTALVTTGQFVHFVWQRRSTQLEMYLDGTKDATTYNIGTTSLYASTASLSIGGNLDGTSSLLGYIDDLRITKGVARYSGASFTPPSVASPYTPTMVSGVVRDSSGNLASRLVRVLNSRTFAIASQDLSNSVTGAYSLRADLGTDKALVISQDTDKDPYFANTSLLLHCNGTNGSTTLTDSAMGLTFSANGNAQISTAQSVFGGAAAYFDGAGDYFTAAVSDTRFAFGTGNFTIEFYVRLSSTGIIHTILDKSSTWGAGGVDFRVEISSGNYIAVLLGPNNSPFYYYGPELTANVWYHVEVSRVSGVLYIFKDGTLLGCGASLSSVGNIKNELCIGSINSDSTRGNYLHGYIDELRITSGVGRHAAAFILPSSPHPDSGVSTTTENAVVYDAVVPM